MSVTLGTAPTSMSLLLVPGADFVCTLDSQSGEWPATAAITIEVANSTWIAALDGASATFSVDSTEVDAVIAAAPPKFQLWYTDGTTRLLWGTGNVLIHRG